jgi:RND superfamily putative drug exporter
VRLALWSTRHRKSVIIGWFLLVIAITLGSGFVGKHAISESSQPGDSGKAAALIDRAFPIKPPSGETLIFDNPNLTVDDPAYKATVDDVVTRLQALERTDKVTGTTVKTIGAIESYYTTGDASRVTPDKHTLLLATELTGDPVDAPTYVKPMMDTVIQAQKDHPDFTILQSGGASVGTSYEKIIAQDFGKALQYTLILTIVLLILAFGTLVPAFIPLLVALTSIVAAVGITGLLGPLFPVAQESQEIILLIGMAVGVDYCLFVISRYRSERSNGHSPDAALTIALGTSGRAVLFSAMTVMVSMAGMFFVNDQTFSSFAIGAIAVTGVSVLGSMTVLPAVISALGTKMDKLRIPFFGREHKGGGIWGFITDRVLKRPVIFAILTLGILVALALPLKDLHLGNTTFDALPNGLTGKEAMTLITTKFSQGAIIPNDLVVSANDVTRADVQAAVTQVIDRAIATGKFRGPVSVRVSDDRSVAIVSLASTGKLSSNASYNAIKQLRNDIAAPMFAQVNGAKIYVAGFTASELDFIGLVRDRTPYVFGFVLFFAFVLLLVSFRSLTIAIKAIVLNLLSVAAGYGVLVLVFQRGVGEGFLNFTHTGAIDAFMPLFMFVILFGLSMDYHIFVLSRIKEAIDRGATNDEAVSEGIKATAGTVTNAATIMVAVFAVFALLRVLQLKEVGVGLGVAVLIDATLIRSVLLPASMKLLGNANWYLPRWLGWLPHVTIESTAPVADERTTAPERELVYAD